MASITGARTMLCSFLWTIFVFQHAGLISAFQVAVPTSLSSSRSMHSNSNSIRDGEQVQEWGSVKATRRTLCRDTRFETTEGATKSSSSSSSLKEAVLKTMESVRDEANEYADMFGLTTADAAFYALFASIIKEAPLGPKGEPFVLRHDEVVKALHQESAWPGFFTIKDLEKAVNDDFLDAALGTTDNRKGWKSKDVSVPRGESFEEARMTFEDVQAALEKGTVIFNSAGAHIPKLAGPSLACTDATTLPCASNLYVTGKGLRTSAPPHTDKQDVVVVQTSGRKHWRIFSPPDPAAKPSVEMFARGKGDDSIPLYALEADVNCELLLDVTLTPGDVLFIPAPFPHTTSTILDDDSYENPNDSNSEEEAHSIHLTMNFDTHIWLLDYLSARRLALRRACVPDTALGQMKDEDNRYVGKANELPAAVRSDLFKPLPVGLLDEDADKVALIVDLTAKELQRISKAVDDETASSIDASVWRDTVERFRQEGMELVDIHRDMYLAAIEEGRKREAEDAMTAHLDQSGRKVMTPERMQRLSLFRVKRFYDKVNESMKTLNDWSYEGRPSADAGDNVKQPLPENWAFTLPIKVGDKVEADLGGAFFEATVIRASGETYDVQYFDGDGETGLNRSMIKLLSPPASASDDDADTLNMTAKQLKRWKKQQEKLNK